MCLNGKYINLYRIINIVIILCSINNVEAQQDSIVDQIYAVLFLDSVTIIADNSVPDIKSMIRRTMDDTTFYRAFQRLRRRNYKFSSELYFYNPGWIPYTYMRSSRIQHVKNGFQSNEILDEYTAPHMMDRKGRYNFYTAQLYDRVFFTHTPKPIPKSWSNEINHKNDFDSKTAKYLHDLKLLLFSPGSDIDIPLMGDRTALFTEDLMKYYNYSVTTDSTTFGYPVYEFNISVDPEAPESKTVIKQMTTLFHPENEQILNRSYQLKYKTLLYSFDVTMDIQIERKEGNYIPTQIDYKGEWDVPLKKPELCKFTFRVTEFLD